MKAPGRRPLRPRSPGRPLQPRAPTDTAVPCTPCSPLTPPPLRQNRTRVASAVILWMAVQSLVCGHTPDPPPSSAYSGDPLPPLLSWLYAPVTLTDDQN